MRRIQNGGGSCLWTGKTGRRYRPSGFSVVCDEAAKKRTAQHAKGYLQSVSTEWREGTVRCSIFKVRRQQIPERESCYTHMVCVCVCVCVNRTTNYVTGAYAEVNDVPSRRIRRRSRRRLLVPGRINVSQSDLRAVLFPGHGLMSIESSPKLSAISPLIG